MTNFIPIFPLGIVVYPGEQLNLHIFEPRYKQLISECFENKKPFGIPVVIDNKINEMGTLLQVVEISRVYEDGKMDIKAEGLKVFRILEIIKELPDKLYNGAIVNYPDNIEKGNRALMQRLITGIKENTGDKYCLSKLFFLPCSKYFCAFNLAYAMVFCSYSVND